MEQLVVKNMKLQCSYCDLKVQFFNAKFRSNVGYFNVPIFSFAEF